MPISKLRYGHSHLTTKKFIKQAFFIIALQSFKNIAVDNYKGDTMKRANLPKCKLTFGIITHCL